MSKNEPTLDAYTKLKDELVSLIIKKREVDAQLAKLEEDIYDKELDYFNDSAYGNIIKGFESFGKMSLGGSNKRKMVYNEEDHIFSMSSATFVKLIMRKQGVNTNGGDLDDYEDSVEPVNASGSNGNTKDSASSTPLRKRK